jgi:chitinase
MRPNRSLPAAAATLLAAGAALAMVIGVNAAHSAEDNQACRPDGLYRTPNLDVPYCAVYDTAGREKLGTNHGRRIIGYFTAWRHGKDGQPAYLVNNIPWDKVTHINYAFAHVDGQNKISVGGNVATNPAIGMTWPGIPGAEIDTTLPYKGHFNLLTKYKRANPNVRTLISVGGWAETGGFFDDSGNRVDSGGFYRMTTNSDNSVNTAGINAFADSVVSFLRTYGFDGVDIDYEYPTSMNNAGNPFDFPQANARRAGLNRSYPVLMKALREKLDAAAATDRKYYLLTVAAPSSGYLLRGMENFVATQYLDYINIMSYDLHGSWNHFVGPNAALYDNGDDAELAFWNVYTTTQYDGAGYLNTDWAYHYFRGAVQAGRINIGVPFYTRGWQGVTGGTNGLWGRAALPDQSRCPAGTGGTVGSTVPCGNGAIGIDNLWHDLRPDGSEEPAGSNPMWHAKNLETGRTGDYLAAYGLTPATDPADRLTGTYARNYSTALVAPWLWNDQKKVFLSTEDEQSIGTKADYVVSKGIGGVMFWEMAGDYKLDTVKNQYFMGSTLMTLLFDKFKTAAPYGNTRAKRTMPTQVLDVKVELNSYALGDNNYPINPKLKITNNSTMTISAGADLQFDYPVSAPGNSADQSDWNWVVTASEHTGQNRGGYRGDFHHVSLKLPTSLSIPPGGSAETPIVYYMPFAGPSNFTLTFGGQTFALAQDYPRGGSVASPTPTGTGSPTPTPTATGGPTPTPTPTGGPGACTAPLWNASTVYAAPTLVTHNGHHWRNKWWTQGETPGVADVWADQGTCSGTPSTPPPGPCTLPAWNASTIYAVPTDVSHNGRKYRNKWWTQNETPGIAQVWEDKGSC